MDAVVALIERVVKEFSWRWFIFVVVVLVSVGAGLWIFEAFTGHFRSSKMRADAEHLKVLADPELKKNVQGDPELEKAHHQLKVNFNRLLEQSQVDVGVPDPLWKAASVFAVWFIVGLVMYSTSDSMASSTIVGLVVIAAFFALIGAALPTYSPRWINFLAYPVGSMLLLFLMGLLVGRVAGSRKRSEAVSQPNHELEPETINCAGTPQPK